MDRLSLSRYLVGLCATGIILVACTSSRQGTQLLPPAAEESNQTTSTAVAVVGIGPDAVTLPKITHISRIRAEQTQKIVISGTGFSTLRPYDGDSPYIKIRDNTAGFNAGHESSSEYDDVTLNVTSWSAHSIVIDGFTGEWGTPYWHLSKGDSLTINVWNAHSGKGPARQNETVL
jgi:hypothetical protein